MSAVTPFDFDRQQVRVRDQDGQPWFVASDVCAALGIEKHRDAIAKLDTDERGSVEVDTLGGRQQVAAVNESGLYTVILRCRDAMTPGTAPHRFRKWVTSEVLPAIRRSGKYAAPAAPILLDDPAALRAALLGYTEKVIALEAAKVELEHQVEEISPKAAIYDRFLNADGLIGLQDLGRVLGQKPNKFIERLKPRYLFDQGGVPTPRQEFVDRGIFRVTSVLVVDKIRKRTWVTAKGVQYFARKLNAEPQRAAA